MSLCFCLLAATLPAADKPQYEIGECQIPPASPDEPTLAEVSIQKAPVYLEQGSVAWTSQKKCISCHTNGIYMTGSDDNSANVCNAQTGQCLETKTGEHRPIKCTARSPDQQYIAIASDDGNITVQEAWDRGSTNHGLRGERGCSIR